MKNIQAVYGFILSILLFFGSISNSQWLNDFQLSSDQFESQSASNGGKSIIVKGDTVIVVWQSAVSPVVRLYSRRSTNGGVTWQDSVQLPGSFSYDCFSPAVALANNRCYVTYIKKESDAYYTIVNISTNYGITWGNTVTVQEYDGFIKSNPVICADSVNVHVAFTYTSNTGVSKVMYKRSTNNGNNFNFSSSWIVNGNQLLPSIACSGSKIYLSYTEEISGNRDIKFHGSTNNGGSFITTQITSDTSTQTRSTVAANGDYVYLAWNESKYGNIDIVCKRSTNGGSSWFTESRLTSHTADQYNPNISASGTNVHIVWVDNRDNYEIYYISGTSYGSVWHTATRLTDNTAVSTNGSIAVSGNTLHVVWTDERTGLGDIYYKRNPTGNAIGINIISTETPESFVLSQNYPNPFNPVTKIRFSISGSSVTQTFLSVYDLLGREVQVLVNKQLQPGTYEANWDASAYPSGVYYYRLGTETYSKTKKMVLIK